MSDLQKNKEEVAKNLKQLESDFIDISGQVEKAKASNNTAALDSLEGIYRTLLDEETRLQNTYSDLVEQEKKPELERIQKLTAELRQPAYMYESGDTTSYVPNYMSMYGMPGATAIKTAAPDPEKVKNRQRELVGEIYNLKGNRELERIPTTLMAQVETLQDPISKARLLENTYGKGSVLPVDIGGTTEFFIKQPDGSVKSTLDKGIASLAGIAAETPALAAEIASFIALGAATKSPAVASAGSAAIGSGIGGLTDEMLRYAYNLKPDIEGTVARRGGQFVLGLGTGMVTDVAIPSMRATRMQNPFSNVFAQKLESSAQRLMTAEQKLAAKEGRKAGKIQVPMGARVAGQEGVDIQSELAGKYARSNIASSARSTQETLVRLANYVKSKASATAGDFSDIAIKKENQRKALAQELSSLTGRNEAIIKNALDRQTRGPLSDVDNLGKILLTSVRDARSQAIKNVKAAREEVFNLADNAGFQITPEEMLDEVARISREVDPSGAANRSAAEEVTNRLRLRRDAPQLLQQAQKEAQTFIDNGQNPPQDLIQRIENLNLLSRPLTAKDFDEFIKGFNEARPKDVFSGKSRDVFGGQIASGLSKYRRDVLGSLTTTRPDGTIVNIGNLFDQYADEVGTRQKYNENLLGSILEEAGGEQSKDSRAIVSAVMREPDSIRRVVQSLRELGAADPSRAGEADQVLGLLQLQYMNDIGIGKGGATQVKIDEGFLDALFGSEAAAQKRSLKAINRNLQTIKGLDSAKLTLDDIKKMGKPLSDKERKELAKSVVKRNQAQKEERELISSAIFDAAKAGNFANMDADVLAQAILNSKSSAQTEMIMKQLSNASLESRNLFKGDFLRNVFDMFPGGKSTANAPFEPIFDTKKFISAYESPNNTGVTPFARNLEIVLGKDTAQQIYDIAKLYEANAIKNKSEQVITAKAGLGPGTSFLYIPVGQIASSARNRVLAAMLSDGNALTTLRNAIAKNAMPGAVNDVYNKMAKDMFLSRKGAELLAHQASSDSEFAAELTNMAKEFEQKENLNQQQK